MLELGVSSITVVSTSTKKERKSCHRKSHSKKKMALILSNRNRKNYLIPRLLNERSIRVMVNESGVLSSILGEDPDLILIHWQVKGGRGLESLNKIRNYQELASSIFLIVPDKPEPVNLPLGGTRKSQTDLFLEQVETFVESNMGEVDFGAEKLAEYMCMTSRTLTRRLEKAVGMTPGQLIRERKITRAKELEQSGVFKTKKELAYAVGFKSAAYLTRLLKSFPIK